MKILKFLLISVLVLFADKSFSQQIIEGLVIEKYYVTDADDAGDPFSEGLNEADTTYRVYLNLCEGCKLREIFGNQNHLLKISSSEPFFNNSLGRTFGHQLQPNLLNISTVGIDSYLSFGGSTTNKLGIPKANDPDGTIWPTGTSTGLLTNNDSSLDYPLTERDGLIDAPDTLGNTEPPGFSILPVEENASDYVTSIFGTTSDSSSFSSENFTALSISSNQGMFGADEENNILIGQFTTAGELSFQLNVKVYVPGTGLVSMVADGSNLQPGEAVNPYLKYPPECGCTDPNYLEYNAAASCDNGSCETLIVFGCTDTVACNFNLDANFNVEALCCYGIDDCGELDPSLACPTLSLPEIESDKFKLYPNPTSGKARLDMNFRCINQDNSDFITIYNLQGENLSRHINMDSSGDNFLEIDFAGLQSGVYIIKINCGGEFITKKLILSK